MLGQWTRKNLMALWDGQPYTTDEEREANWAECDRIMIALHLSQTKGRVNYRRIVGMHGGGGGCSNEEYKKIFNEKMEKDLKSHYNGVFPEDGYWPNPTPNAAPPTKIDTADPNRVYSYSWCWHGEPEFMPWHRPYVAEFERCMQDYDPKYDDDQRYGEDAIGCPYWGWEGWDGLSLPQPLANPIYHMKSDAFHAKGYPIGSTIRNPFYRWWTPVSLGDQVAEKFPKKFSNANTTTRSGAFSQMGEEFSHPWELMSTEDGKSVSMRHEVRISMSDPDWDDISSTEKGVGVLNFENSHNKFHMHVAGKTKGGVLGAGTHDFVFPDIFVDATDDDGKPILDDDGKPKKVNKTYEWGGQMGNFQSAFDPMFWLHHCNVERQFISWQRAHIHKGGTSIPSEEQMKRVLYPWTKPDLLFSGKLSYNTASSDATDGTFGDWWPYETLPYKFDHYLTSQVEEAEYEDCLVLTAFFDVNQLQSGEYTLYHVKDQKVKILGSQSKLKNSGGGCARCASKDEGQLSFFLSDEDYTKEEAEAAVAGPLQFFLKRDGNWILVTRAEVNVVKSRLPALAKKIIFDDK